MKYVFYWFGTHSIDGLTFGPSLRSLFKVYLGIVESTYLETTSICSVIKRRLHSLDYLPFIRFLHYYSERYGMSDIITVFLLVFFI